MLYKGINILCNELTENSLIFDITGKNITEVSFAREKYREKLIKLFNMRGFYMFEKFASNSTPGHFLGVFNDFLLSTDSKQVYFKKISEKEKKNV